MYFEKRDRPAGEDKQQEAGETDGVGSQGGHQIGKEYPEGSIRNLNMRQIPEPYARGYSEADVEISGAYFYDHELIEEGKKDNTEKDPKHV